MLYLILLTLNSKMLRKAVAVCVGQIYPYRILISGVLFMRALVKDMVTMLMLGRVANV